MTDSGTKASLAHSKAQPNERPARPRDVVLAILVGGAISIVVNAVIAAIARGPLDASTQFQPLAPAAFITWTIIGTVIGAIGWFLITRKARRPRALVRWLVPTVVLVSFIPDIAVWISDSMPGTSAAAVLSLMAMHLATAAVLVSVFLRFMPPQDTNRR